MKIDHIAIWVADLEKMRRFYQKYFGGVANEKYHNKTTGFQSYFLSFGYGCRLEIMKQPGIGDAHKSFDNQKLGIIHFAISVGSMEKVDNLTKRLKDDGYQVAREPRTTGDGYYESVILDPEGNIVELTA